MKEYHYPEAIASLLVVGLGQIFKGESRKGLLLLLTFYFVLPAAIYLSLILNGQIFVFVLGAVLLAGIILWVHSIYDALRS